jgi:hypothetical protein
MHGASFDVDLERDLLPIGLRVPRIDLQMGGEVIRLSGRVRNLVRTSRGSRCGIELDPVDDATHRQLSDAIVRNRYPMLEDAGHAGFDELWQFFRESGFVDSEKEALLEPVLGEVRRTFDALAACSGRVARSMMIRENGLIVAHIAGLRAYRRTWMIHHLAALQGRHVGGIASEAATEYLVHNTDFEYLRAWFYARARFPVRMFGGFARKVADPRLSDLRRVAHGLIPVDARFDRAPADIAVQEAGDHDLATVERYFVAHERPLLVRAEDLTRGGLKLDTVRRSYEREGVERRRMVLMAKRGEQPLGFAVLEISSLGLTLSDSLSSFRMFVMPRAHAERQSVRSALLNHLLPIYAESSRRFARVLLPPADSGEYRALGITLDDAESLCWTIHRTQFRPFIDHMQRLFSLLSSVRKGARVKLPDAV